MRVRYYLYLWLSCLIIYSCENSHILHVRTQPVGDAHVQGQFLIVTGAGGIKSHQAREMERSNLKLSARRAAILDAERNALRYLDLAERVKVGSVEYEHVEGVVKGSEVIREEWTSDNQYNITLKIRINGAGSLAEGLGYKKIAIR